MITQVKKIGKYFKMVLLNTCNRTGTDISTSLLAPASEFSKKGLSGKYILVFTCPNRQADFLNTKHIFFYSEWPKYPGIFKQFNKLKRKWFSNLQIHDKQYMPI